VDCAGATSRAFRWVHVPGFPYNAQLEVSRLSLKRFDLRIDNQLYIPVPSRGNEFRRNNSHGTIVGGECLVELCHKTADTGSRLYQVNLETRIGKVKRCLYSTDPAANDSNRANLTTLIQLSHLFLL
jgi:hypothetical protein